MSPFDQLTPRQANIFEFIRDKIENRGYGPTVREIGEQFSISSPNGVMCHLKALEKKGLIHRSPKRSRAIELSQDVLDETRGLPLAGRVAAGPTALAFEQNQRVDFGDLFSNPDLFALEVSGDSMIDAQIASGDYVILRRQETASEGEIVVAMTDENEATLKYWFPESNGVRLQPANAEMDPIYVDDATVLGVLVGVVRRV